MRICLDVKDVSVPFWGEPYGRDEEKEVLERLRLWEESDFAGYRRLVTEGSDCYPSFKEVRELAVQKAKGATGKPIRDFVLLGTGGSSLGPETLIRALRANGQAPYFHFMDNNDPDWFAKLLKHLNPEETLVYVVSKSGRTPETISQFLTCLDWSKAKLGEGWREHFVICTDPDKGDLRELARRWKLPWLPVPSPVGGRFSVLTPVGLFPAAFAGLDIEAFFRGAQSVLQWGRLSLTENPCAKLARALVKGREERNVTVLMPYSSHLGAFSRWFCQLWAESLGKDGHGLTPYPATGTTDQHSQVQLYMEGPKDKAIVLVHVKQFAEKLPINVPADVADLPAFAELKNRSMLDLFDAEFRATRDALTKQGVPNATIEIDRIDEYSIGALFFFWEWATSIAGAVMGVNPYDQPGVEAAKILTKKYLGEVSR
jgi:glucose-6-phosphate isomerase